MSEKRSKQVFPVDQLPQQNGVENEQSSSTSDISEVLGWCTIIHFLNTTSHLL